MPKGVYARTQEMRLKIAEMNRLDDPNDIVGLVYGRSKVLSLENEIEGEVGVRRYAYKCECVVCGCISVRKRTSLLTSKSLATQPAGCRKCADKRKMRNTTLRKTAANKGNTSTGIRHYHIFVANSRDTNLYTHVIQVMIDGKKYIVRRGCMRYSFNDKEYVKTALEVNRVLKSGGKEGFLKWYTNDQWSKTRW